jgi:hypothetical protein
LTKLNIYVKLSSMTTTPTPQQELPPMHESGKHAGQNLELNGYGSDLTEPEVMARFMVANAVNPDLALQLAARSGLDKDPFGSFKNGTIGAGRMMVTLARMPNIRNAEGEYNVDDINTQVGPGNTYSVAGSAKKVTSDEVDETLHRRAASAARFARSIPRHSVAGGQGNGTASGVNGKGSQLAAGISAGVLKRHPLDMSAAAQARRRASRP